MINRRDLMKATSMTAALAASGQLPLWAAENGACYAVEGFAQLLKKYQLPKTSKGSKKLSYRLYSKTTDLGELTVTRKGKSQLSCDYSTVPPSTCKADFLFNGALASGLAEWKLTSSTTTKSTAMQALGTYTETGKVAAGEAIVRVGKTVTERFKTTRPVQPDFTLPFVVPTLPAELGKEYQFTLLREGTFFFAGQSVFFDGMVTVPLKGGKKEFRNYLHVGDGTLPTNYLVDENGVVVIVTHGLVAEMLIGEPMPAPEKAVSKPKEKGDPDLVRLWVKGNRKKQKEGSFVKMFTTSKGKTVVTVRQPDGTEVNIPHKILTPEDLAYLESIQAGIKH